MAPPKKKLLAWYLFPVIVFHGMGLWVFQSVAIRADVGEKWLAATLVIIAGFSMAIFALQILGYLISSGTPDKRYKTGYKGNASGDGDWVGGPYHFFIWVLSTVVVLLLYGYPAAVGAVILAIAFVIPVVILALVLKIIANKLEDLDDEGRGDRWKWLRWLA